MESQRFEKIHVQITRFNFVVRSACSVLVNKQSVKAMSEIIIEWWRGITETFKVFFFFCIVLLFRPTRVTSQRFALFYLDDLNLCNIGVARVWYRFVSGITFPTLAFNFKGWACVARQRGCVVQSWSSGHQTTSRWDLSSEKTINIR